MGREWRDQQKLYLMSGKLSETVLKGRHVGDELARFPLNTNGTKIFLIQYHAQWAQN